MANSAHQTSTSGESNERGAHGAGGPISPEPAGSPSGPAGGSGRAGRTVVPDAAAGFRSAVRARRAQLGLTLHAAARAAGCATSYLSAIESGARRRPSDEVLRRIEVALAFAPGSLVRMARWEEVPEALRESAARRLGNEVPVLATGREHGTPPGDSASSEYVRCPDCGDPDAFAVRIEDESMLPEYRPRDLVVFSPARAASNGADCLARVRSSGRGRPADGAGARGGGTPWGGSGRTEVFVRIYFEAGAKVRLQPLNPAFPARIVRVGSVELLAPAVGLVRRLAEG